MNFPRYLTRPTILSVLALTLGGCAQSMGKLAVDLKASIEQCQRLGGPVSVSEIGEDTDFRDLSVEAGAAIDKANRQDAARTRCENGVVAKYAKANQ